MLEKKLPRRLEGKREQIISEEEKYAKKEMSWSDYGQKKKVRLGTLQTTSRRSSMKADRR